MPLPIVRVPQRWGDWFANADRTFLVRLAYLCDRAHTPKTSRKRVERIARRLGWQPN